MPKSIGSPEVEMFTDVLRGLASDLKKIASSIEILPPLKSLRPSSDNSTLKSALSKSLSQISFVTESMSSMKLKPVAGATGNPVYDRIRYSAYHELEICIDAYYSSENSDPMSLDLFNDHCEALIGTSVNTEAVDSLTGANALCFAAGSGSTELTLALIKRGYSVNCRDLKLRTPIFWAVSRGNLEICQLLIKHGAKLTLTNNLGNTVLHLATKLGRFEILPILVKILEFPDIPGKDRKTPLHLAVAGNFLEAVQTLMDYGACAAEQDSRGWSALHFAAHSGNLEICSLLLKRSNKSLREIRDREGLNAADIAAKFKPGNSKLKNLLDDSPIVETPRAAQLLFAKSDKICMQLSGKFSEIYKIEIKDCTNNCVRLVHLKRGSENVEEANGAVTLWIPAAHLVKGRNFQVRLAGGVWSKPAVLEPRKCALCPSVAISETDTYCQLHFRRN